MCYVFDFCGGSLKSQSDGSMTDMSVLTEVEDLETVFNTIINLPIVDKSNIFLIGESQGGVVSALTAVQYNDSIRALVLLYPALIIPDDARKICGSYENIPDNPTALGVKIGKIYYEDVIDMNIFDEISGFDKDVLIFHGTADKLVPMEYSRKAAEVYKSAEFVPIEGAKHGFKDIEFDIAAEKIYKFIMKEII